MVVRVEDIYCSLQDKQQLGQLSFDLTRECLNSPASLHIALSFSLSRGTDYVLYPVC